MLPQLDSLLNGTWIDALKDEKVENKTLTAIAVVDAVHRQVATSAFYQRSFFFFFENLFLTIITKNEYSKLIKTKIM